MQEPDQVVVGSFRSRVEAELAQGALDAAGIASVLTADDAGGLYPNLLVPSGGVRLQVRPEDAALATEVLSQPAGVDDPPA
jgi:hypothetical protein